MTTTRSLTLHRTPARPSLRSRRVGALAALALSVATLGSACSASGPEKIAAPTTKAPVTAVASTNTDAPTTTAAPTGADPQVAATSMVVRSDHDIALHDGPEGATTKTVTAFRLGDALVVGAQDPAVQRETLLLQRGALLSVVRGVHSRRACAGVVDSFARLVPPAPPSPDAGPPGTDAGSAVTPAAEDP